MSVSDRIKLFWLRFWQGKPEHKVRIIAVAGSAGKTSVSEIIYHIMNSSHIKVGMINSHGVFAFGELLYPNFSVNSVNKAELTLKIARLVKLGANIIILEIPDTLVAKEVINDLQFDSTVLTNIYGGDNAEHVFAPIAQTVPEGLAVINKDDDATEWVMQRAGSIPQNIYAAFIGEDDLEVTDRSRSEIKFKFANAFFEAKMHFDFELTNYLLAIQLCLKYLGSENIDIALNSFRGSQGMMQFFTQGGIDFIIDKLHKPWLLAHHLPLIASTGSEQGRKILVLGIDERELELDWEEISKSVDILLLSPVFSSTQKMESIVDQIAKQAEKAGVVLVERIEDHSKVELISLVNLKQKIHRVLVDNGDTPMISFEQDSASARQDAITVCLNIVKEGDLVILAGVGGSSKITILDVDYNWGEHLAISRLFES